MLELSEIHRIWLLFVYCCFDLTREKSQYIGTQISKRELANDRCEKISRATCLTIFSFILITKSFAPRKTVQFDPEYMKTCNFNRALMFYCTKNI